MSRSSYPLAEQAGELERLQLQSRVWEPSGRRLLDEIGPGQGARVLDIGCGAMCWLRVLSEWVGPDGEVVGTDIDEQMLSGAEQFVTAEGLGNVTLVKDDLFASELEPSSFDLVHARFQIAPLGRGPQQMATHLRLVRPGGTVVLEELDPLSWHFIPPAPALAVPLSRGVAVQGLIPLLGDAFRRAGGDPNAAVTVLELFRSAGIEPQVRAEVQALPPGHPYLRLPLQFATALDGRLRSFVDDNELDQILEEAERELQDPGRWGLTFTLVQCWARRTT
ncbi:methyltransferase domain-containing protein [Kribbella sancticallisti]|uniref:Methyltransferase domain-containing protein n=1 Tax=Kribbella sancticallisti TaxID=460087 RepID=A0ABN2DKZ3_9ACTN